MSGHLDRLAEARLTRDAARAVFDARLEQVRDDLSARGVGGRVADRIGEDARSAFGEAIDIAADSKGIIAGTIAMLALWFMRQPIFAWIGSMIDQDDDTEDDGERGGDRKEGND